MTEWKDERKTAVKAQKRQIPKMPEGYYSGDKPNPNLRAFVEAHLQERPYDPLTDKYDVPAFDHPIESTKATAIYNMHTYWSKKPHDAIREYIKHYTKPGDLVLDPFCGSGGTALAALMEGRKAIAIDRSPAATFITKNYCTPVDVDELRRAFEDLKEKIKPEIDWLYETRCDRCGGKATIAYTVYSQVFQCPRCMEKVPLFDCPEIEGKTKAGKSKTIRVCPHCCKRGLEEEIKTTGEHFGAKPVLVSYICRDGCKPAKDERNHDDLDPRKREYSERYDLGKIREIKAMEIPHWFPDAELSDVIPYRMLYKKDFRPEDAKRLVDLFTKRNLWALAATSESIKDIEGADLRVLLSWVLLKCSRIMRFCDDGIGRIMMGTYYIPQISRESNVSSYLSEAFNQIISHHIAKLDYLSNKTLRVNISTQDARNIEQIRGNSVDYIFTDPSYADKIQYGELNFVWEAWLGFDTNWCNDEIVVNEIRGKTEADWAKMMHQAMAECYRVLKPGRAISLCYHDTSEGTWVLIQDIMAEVGFVVEKSKAAIFIDTTQKSFNQINADKVNKRDRVINFRKPKPGENEQEILITELDDFASINVKVCNIIRDFLSHNPGSTKDHIFDEVVSRMVRRGQMESHRFDDLLSQVAEPVHPEGEINGAAHWYLRETEIEDSAESAKEDAAADAVRKFIARTKKLEDEGVHYSDIFEHYVYTIPAKDKPRRSLAEWLLDYFYKTEEGTYRLPATEEEEQIKKEGRSMGVSRQIKRYLAYLEHGVPVPASERPVDATLVDWICHCKRSGMYEQGKLLYEKGGLNLESLTEEEQVNVDEDYQICAKMLTRMPKSEKKPKRIKKSQMGLEGFES